MEDLKRELICCHRNNKKFGAILNIGRYFQITLKERKELCDLYWNTCDSEKCADDIIAALKKDYKNHTGSWDELAESFSVWAWGKTVPHDINELQSFFKIFVDEAADSKFYPPTIK